MEIDQINNKANNGGATPLVNPTHTDSVVSPEDASIARLVRKSSLVEIDPIPLPGDDEYNTRKTERQKVLSCHCHGYIITSLFRDIRFYGNVVVKVINSYNYWIFIIIM